MIRDDTELGFIPYHQTITKVMVINYDEIIEYERLICAKEVEKLTGLSRVTLWRKSNDIEDPFPEAFRNGTHYTRWKLAEILAWMNTLRSKQDEFV